MRELRWLLWFYAGIFFLGAPFVVLPWDTLNAWVTAFGVEALSDDPVIMYMVRMYCGMAALGGVYFVLLARDLERYRALVWFSAWGLIALGVLAALLGWIIAPPWVVFVWDALFCIIGGAAMAVLVTRALPVPPSDAST